MDFNINQDTDNIITRIVFTNWEREVEGVEDNGDNTICVFDAQGCEAYFYISDIDNLIKALSKAKELFK